MRPAHGDDPAAHGDDPVNIMEKLTQLSQDSLKMVHIEIRPIKPGWSVKLRENALWA